MNEIFWTTFFILLAIGFVGTLTVIPYSLALNPEGIETLKAKLAEKKTPLPAWLVILLASGGQGLVLSAVSVFLGLLAADKMGLQLPIFKAIASGQPLTAEMLSFLPIAALFGALSGALLVALEYFFFLKRLPESMTSKVKKLVFWKSALACFYGGFVEEILLRLFVMSGIAWLISLVWKTDGVGMIAIFWIANILSSLLFGAGHLPATAALTKLTPMILFRAFLLNGIVGLVCGWLYMRFGLEAAMAAHFSADIVLHIIGQELFVRAIKLELQPA